MNSLVYGKVPPQAKDLEEAVLGAVLLERKAFDVVIEPRREGDVETIHKVEVSPYMPQVLATLEEMMKV